MIANKIGMIAASLLVAAGAGFGWHAATADTAAAPVAPSTSTALVIPASLTLTDLGAADECGGAAVTQDAASCFDGGWSYIGCCVGSIPHSKFKKGTAVKCCGACME